jgi:hypothetical protein
MRGVSVAVVIEAAGFLEDTGELDAAGTHVLDVSLRGGVAVFEGSLLLGLAPEDFVVAVGVERGIDVNQINAGIGEFGELFEVVGGVAAIDDACVEEGGGFAGFGCGLLYAGFCGDPLFGHVVVGFGDDGAAGGSLDDDLDEILGIQPGGSQMMDFTIQPGTSGQNQYFSAVFCPSISILPS